MAHFRVIQILLFSLGLLCCVFNVAVICVTPDRSRDVKQQPELYALVRGWAEKLGGELWGFGEVLTRRKIAIENYRRTTIETDDGDSILKDMQEKIQKMMEQKVSAVKRIMEVAENKAVSQGDNVEPTYDFYDTKNLINSALNETNEDSEREEDAQSQRMRLPDESSVAGREDERFNNIPPEEGFQRDELPKENIQEPALDPPPKLDSGKVSDGTEEDAQASQVPPQDKRKLLLLPNPHFYNIPVNINYSAVHVPSNVYARATEVIRGIKWSEELDKTFANNYKQDPTLSWQYFGSSTGFMRQYPAMIWKQEPVDLFDCRTRSWYIEAASSPKDIVILVDRSGSMTGMRREIARHVVNNILDTLGNNDYVNIFAFSNTSDPLLECFSEMLVQANLANVRAFKEALNEFKTEQIANFSLALTTAFKLLEVYRGNHQGAQCNQAIMLVTDGVQYNFKEIFKEYNWQNLPFMPVRVFTYLIGREVSDVREVKWMACANQGYYVHLSTYAEVREQVLNYIPVMARPMVLNPSVKPNPTWSPVYADVTDPKLTNWLWITREQNKQRDRFLTFRRNSKAFFISEEQDRKYVHQQKPHPDNYGDVQLYRLMTSVSMPVYDRRPNANITEQIQVNEATWITITRETRVANLLGVAGTDIPIENIERLMMPFRVGVNGYAFIVTNNGYILTHPDLRPVFQGILKPAYNRVDLIEVEVMDDDAEPRDFNESIKELRRSVVMQHKGHTTLRMKSHMDDLRRIMITNRHYYYTGINGTPFSLVLSLPDHYGFNRVKHLVDEEPHRIRSSSSMRLSDFFAGNFTVHPEWFYCKYLDDKHRFQSPEEEVLHFLEQIESPGWKWGPTCDTRLMKSLVADGKMTSWFSQNIHAHLEKENKQEFAERYGITVVFIATYTGLTRWQDLLQATADGDKSQPHFHHLNNKAIDEIWYRRAIEQYFVQPTSFVYSVPIDIGNRSNTLVTATNAIFKEDGPKRAPAAVVGFQFYHSTFHSYFTKITGQCGADCLRSCTSEELYCLVVDDNGYVIVSDKKEDTGRFFGEIRYDILEQLVEEGVYKATRMYDYQATCSQPRDSGSAASCRHLLFSSFANTLQWFFGTLVTLMEAVMGNDLDLPYYGEEEETGEPEYTASDDLPSAPNEKELYRKLLIKKTRPEPCDQSMWLYTMSNKADKSFNKTMSTDCTRPFIVQPVSNSNLILVVINNICPEVKLPEQLLPTPVEVDYNMSLTCYKVLFNSYPRRNYMSCINRNILEREIQLCGKGTIVSVSYLLIALQVFSFFM